MAADEYFLSKKADEADLSPWEPILPVGRRVLRTNLFGDVFIADKNGAVYMLERSACSAAQIARSEEDFWHQIHYDAQGWQLRFLADECRFAGKILGEGQCYAFATLPVLGGDYSEDNVWVASWDEWFGVTADIFQQIKDVPDGTAVSIKAPS
jgi:hypothetical protein